MKQGDLGYKRCMDGEEFLQLFNNKLLRTYIMRSSLGFSRNPDVQEDLIQEAWIRISLHPSGRDLHFYVQEAFRAMNACYQRYWQYWNKGRKHEKREKHRTCNRLHFYLKKKKIF